MVINMLNKKGYNDNRLELLLNEMEEVLRISKYKPVRNNKKLLIKLAEDKNKGTEQYVKSKMQLLVPQLSYIMNIDYFMNSTSFDYSNIENIGILYDTLKISRTRKSILDNLDSIISNISNIIKISNKADLNSYSIRILRIALMCISYNDLLSFSIITNLIADSIEVNKGLVNKKERIRQLANKEKSRQAVNKFINDSNQPMNSSSIELNNEVEKTQHKIIINQRENNENHVKPSTPIQETQPKRRKIIINKR